jgi:hypothetical protein
MTSTIPARFIDAFVKGFGEKLKDRIYDGLFVAAGLLWTIVSGGSKLSNWRDHFFETVAPFVIVLFALAAWHVIKGVRVLWGEMKSEKDEGFPMPAYYKAKIAVVGAFALFLIGWSSYTLWSQAKPKETAHVDVSEKDVKRSAPEKETNPQPKPDPPVVIPIPRTKQTKPPKVAVTNTNPSAANSQSATVTPSQPPFKQDCRDSNCATSFGQQGGVTAGQINIGTQDWEIRLNKEKQDLLIGALSGAKGTFTIEWWDDDLSAMRVAGGINYAFHNAGWTEVPIPNYAGSRCYPNNEWDCYGFQVVVKDKNSDVAKTAIAALSAWVTNPRIVEDSKRKVDVDVFLSKPPR